MERLIFPVHECILKEEVSKQKEKEKGERIGLLWQCILVENKQ